MQGSALPPIGSFESISALPKRAQLPPLATSATEPDPIKTPNATPRLRSSTGSPVASASPPSSPSLTRKLSSSPSSGRFSLPEVLKSPRTSKEGPVLTQRSSPATSRAALQPLTSRKSGDLTNSVGNPKQWSGFDINTWVESIGGLSQSQRVSLKQWLLECPETENDNGQFLNMIHSNFEPAIANKVVAALLAAWQPPGQQTPGDSAHPPLAESQMETAATGGQSEEEAPAKFTFEWIMFVTTAQAQWRWSSIALFAGHSLQLSKNTFTNSACSHAPT
ncbi:putative sodium-and chloride-dependent neutral and basic amino acid transporter [Planoprotostelium fungivorum]|uniref:Putative sodium-and chloride-dependent neutral and basic amino acid transporter n=1 Tax=Planoprotostelium fungivorum TaxID=1890364 RepID=A0A2P6MUG0_9EUKA|nr:putative sodium-and chloride-dependent neutral and basic amino acid transporter [Planoprotostelium fungivorum]